MTAAVAQPAPRHWSFALFGALLLHAGLALVFHQMLDTGAAGAGRAGIEVGLGPAGGAPGEAAGAAAPQEVAEVVPDAAPEAEAVPAAAAETPPETLAPMMPSETVAASVPPPAAESAVPEAVPLYAPVESVPVVSGDAPAETIVVEPAMPVPPLPRVKPRPPELATPTEPKPVEPKPAEVAEAVAEPVPEPQEVASEAVTAQAAPSAATTQGPPGQAAQSGTDGKAGTGARTASGTTESRSGGGNLGAIVDYAARLNAWLERHKEYPRRASLRRQEGEATLYFVIDRAGRVLDFRVEKSTGYKILDEEVVNMIKRASPLPAPPESVTGDTLEYRVPVGFDQH